MPAPTDRRYGAAHIVTEDANMGDPEIIIMTRHDPEDLYSEELIERYPLPSSHADLDVAVADLFTLTGWTPERDYTVAHAGTGYAVVNVERDPDVETAHVIVGPHGELATTVIHVDVPGGFEPDVDEVYIWARRAYQPWAWIRHDEQGLIIWAVKV